MQKNILITGSTSGIGKALALYLAKQKHHILVCSRSIEKVNDVVREIKDNNGSAEGFELDLVDLESVKRFCDSISVNIDIVVLNAGISSWQLEFSPQGLESTFATNHLGQFYLTERLLLKYDLDRVILVSSGTHDPKSGSGVDAPVFDLERWARPKEHYGSSVYSSSKLANVLYGYNLAERRPDIIVTSYDPGFIGDTGFMRALGIMQPIIKIVIETRLAITSWWNGVRNQTSTLDRTIPFLAKLTVDPQYSTSGKYYSIDELLDSSDISYEKDKQKALYEFSLELLQEKGFGISKPVLTGNPTVKTGDCCKDSGVICDDSNSGIVELHLQLSKLAGSVPTSIGSLTNLTYLYLNNNTLSGNIPNSIGNLVKLKELTLNDNQLTGTLPAELANCKQLNTLTAARNKLQGPIPVAIQNMDYYVNFNLGDLSVSAATTTTDASLAATSPATSNSSNSSNTTNSGSSNSTPVVIGVVAAIVVVGILIFVGILYTRKKSSPQVEDPPEQRSRSKDPITLPNIENVGTFASLSRSISSKKPQTTVTESTVHTTETYKVKRNADIMPPIAMAASSPSQNTMVSFARSDTIDQKQTFVQQPPLMPFQNEKVKAIPPTMGAASEVSVQPPALENAKQTAIQPPLLTNSSPVGELPIMANTGATPQPQNYQPPIIQKSKPKTRRKIKDDLDFEDSDEEEKAKSGTSALADFFNESRIEKPSRETTPVGSMTNIGIINESERNEFMPPTMK
ncbi:hypothetical protein HDV06_005840 [Boothiomyces sp. JEL0866]|nr:hypothetical protein HDV06_005840 [Boothiomyces sp. JEL0866]